MGVDASAICGYMANIDEIEWDFEYLRNKFNLNEKIPKGWLDHVSYGDLIESLERAIQQDESIDDHLEEIEGWYGLGEALGFKHREVYGKTYIYYSHEDVINTHPTGILDNFDTYVENYARLLGVKNPEIFKWDLISFFD